MGTYRFLLALTVLVAHTGFRPQGHEPGASAVVSFLILSGYVMTRLVERHYATPARWPLFYLDRAARIFPQFLFYLLVSIVLVSQHWISFSYASACAPGDALLNLLALPLGWSRLIGLDCQYLPQAWSLGLELSFYLLVPWLLWSPPLTRGVVALSIVCFAAALCQRIDPDTFAYRTLPGTLFMFAVGIAFARPALLGRWFPHLVCIAATALALAGRQAPWSATIGQDVLIGLALGVPLVGLVRNCRGAADEWLGNISYGLFLNHLLIMNVSEQVIGVPIDTPAALFGLIIVSSAAALLTYRLLERPILNWRHAVRDRPAPTPLVAAAGIAPD